MEQRTPEWHEARKGLVTASAAGAILGCAPYAARADVMRRMVRAAHGAEDEFGGNIATEYGAAHEDGALIDFRLETGMDVEKVGFIARDGWAGCSPDGLIGNDGGVEIKCPFGKRKDAAPDFKPLAEQPHYYAQVQFSLWVTGRAWWKFYQWAPRGHKLEHVKPDPDWLAENLPILRAFHDEYSASLHEPSDHLAPRRAVIDTPEAAMMLREYDELGVAIENATARRKEMLGQFAAMAKDRDAEIAGRKLTRVQRAGAVAYAKALAALAPDADLEPYRGRPSSYWKLG